MTALLIDLAALEAVIITSVETLTSRLDRLLDHLIKSQSRAEEEKDHDD